METLPLRPLPLETSEDAKGYRRIQSEGFLDETVVTSVVNRGAYDRVYVKPEEMVLSSSEEDFAGWALPVASPFRDLMEVENQAPVAAPVRQPAPPVLESRRDGHFPESGLAEPHTGSHRWWLFGVSGAMTCAILSLTLVSLAQRNQLREVVDGYVPAPPASSVPAGIVENPKAIQPALTSIIQDK